MQAIQTKVIPATNTKPTRIKAFAQAGSITISYDYEGVEAAHRKAAEALAAKFGWNYGRLIEGYLPNGDAVFVFPE